MTRSELVKKIKEKMSYLCIGLDTDLSKIPAHLMKEKDPVFSFNKEIIDRTAKHCVAYKLNLAFYESRGMDGWESLVKTVEYIPEGIFKIADAKRGDIGNTAEQYARSFFETMNFDAVTLSPYMGKDSIEPFLNYEGKWAIILGLTSNPGASDFQLKRVVNMDREEYLYESIIRSCSKWAGNDRIMFVAGANRVDHMKGIRDIVPEHFLLLPGVGAQGASLAEMSGVAMNKDIGLLVNSSRAIIYSDQGNKFGEMAELAARKLNIEMKELLISGGVFPPGERN